MKISKECKEQIKKLLEEFFECTIDKKYNIKTIIFFIQYCTYHKRFRTFNHLPYSQVWKSMARHIGLDKLIKILRKCNSSKEIEELYNKLNILIAYHNKDYNYLANKIANLLSSL